MNGGWGGLLAIVAAWLVFMVAAPQLRRFRGKINIPFPASGGGVWGWVKALVKADPEPDPGPEPDPAGYRLENDPKHPSRTVVLRVRDGRGKLLAPATVRQRTRDSALDVWVHRSLEAGAAPVDIIREGMPLFGKSESTVKRSIGKVKRREHTGRQVRADA